MTKTLDFESQTVIAEKMRKERDYWLNKLSGEITKSAFPYDLNKAFGNEIHMEKVRFSFPGDISARLVKISSGSDPNLYVILQSGVILLLNKYTGNKDILIGTPVLKQEAEKNFLNTVLVIRNTVDGKEMYREYLRSVRQSIAEATENQNYPIETLVYKLGLEYSDINFPLFDTAVQLKNIQDKSYLEPIKPNILFTFERNGEQVEGEIEYNTYHYKKRTVQRLIEHTENLLRAAIYNSAIPVGEIEIISDEEKKQVLEDFNSHWKGKEAELEAAFPPGKSVRHYVEKYARQNPGKIAVAIDDRQVSYGELNRRVNRLARVLREKGVRRGHYVGIMAKRSILMAESILAAWKIGAAYIPIDPEAPMERVRYMLDDCRIPVLLTDSKEIEKFSFTALQGYRYKMIDVRKTGRRRQVTEFDEFPVPDRSQIDCDKYNRYIGQALVKNSISLQATRGCPYNCAYCHKIWPKKHVVRSAQNVFEELTFYYQLGVRRFVIIDDIFNFDRENSARFFELIVENGFDIQLFFPNGLRGDVLTREYIDLMVRAGTVEVALALETASPRLQKLIQKNLDLEKLKENIEYFCREHPHVILELFTMHGFPTETEEEAMMTMNFLKSIKWIHFPYIEILKIFPNTPIEKLAVENGVSEKLIAASERFAFHEFSDTLPFDRDFTLKYKSDYLNEYFLSKERLLHVLPHQMRILTEDELVQKYNSYLDTPIKSFSDLLKFTGIGEDEINRSDFLDERKVAVPGLNRKLQEHFPRKEAEPGALKLLLVDLSQHFSADTVNELYDVVEPPLGMLYLMTYLDRQYGGKINGKIAKSRIDFDNYEALKDICEQFKPDIIGVRALSYYKDFFHKTVGMMRHWGIDVPIIAGGPYATSAYERILQDRNIDLAVLGEGELTLAELVEKMIDNNNSLPTEEELSKIDGIAYMSKEKENTGETYAREILLLDQVENQSAWKSGDDTGDNREATDMSDNAYVIYTSGSTGNPKGAVVEHRGMMNHIGAKISDLRLTGDSVIVQNASQYFDISVWQFFAALAVGGKTVIYPDELVMEPQQFQSKLVRDRVTILEVVPSYLSVLLSVQGREKVELDKLEYLLVTGETLKTGLVERWYEKYDGIEMVNAYGPTEASDDITHYIMDKAPDQEQIPIGKPLRNLNIYIVDENMKLCPVGVKGEIVVSGIGVGKGYLNDPEKTAGAYMTDPFSGDGAVRLYRTGDLGSWRPDGNIDFYGRKDYQVKIRGYRIELEEIEKKLVTNSDIAEAAVIDKEMYTPGEPAAEPSKYLCAFLVPETRMTLDFDALREYLGHLLPEYMVPDYYEQLEQMPLTPNGKIDKKALAKLEITLPEEGYTAAGNAVEKKLVDIWSDILKVAQDTIGIDSNFFHLGGHSLRATLLMVKVRKEFDVEIQLKDIFERPTIRQFSKHLQQSVKENAVVIEPVEELEHYPLSSAQNRLYIIQQMDPDGISYNLPSAHMYEGSPDKRRLEETFRKLILRHEVFRTSIRVIDEEPRQVIHPEVDFELENYRAPEAETEEGRYLAYERLIDEKFVRPFDLSRPPFMRVGIMEQPDEKYIMMMDMHHIIVDGVCGEILMREFTELYAGKELEPLTLQYKDYSRWQIDTLESPRMKKQEKYWQERFRDGVPPLALATDNERTENMDLEAEFHEFVIDEEMTDRLRQMIKEEETTLYVALNAVYNILLSAYTGRDDIVVGCAVAGRAHAGLEDMIGMFINMLAMRNRPEKSKTFREFQGEVTVNALDAFENQDYQYDDLVKKLGYQGDGKRNTLFETQFTLQNIYVLDEDVEVKGTDRKGFDYKKKYVPFELSLTAEETRKAIIMNIVYVKALFNTVTIEKMARHYIEILEQVLSNRDIRIDEIGITHEMSTAQSDYTKEEFVSFEF